VLAGIAGEGAAAHLKQNHGTPAVRHLFRVAASLDSLVVGEPQILGQLKESIEIAREGRTLGHVLEKAVRRAVRVGKRVRSETAIGEGQVSVSSVAVERARLIFGELTGHQALLVGAGEMAEAAARLLVREGARLSVVNRSPERAAALAMDVGGVPRAWSELDRCLVEADVVISSTSSPQHVITLSLVKAARKARRGRELFLIDIAVPRDVDPAVNDLDGVYLYDVDDLSQIVASSMEGRAAAVEQAEGIVAEASLAFERWTLERSLTPTIVGLRARTRAVLLAELERSLTGKLRHLGAAERTALGAMVDAATNKLLHAPTVRLRGAASDPRAADYIEALRELFDLPDVSNASESEPDADAEADDDGDEEAAAMSGPSAGARAGHARGA
jgi:glutamyl-tRNA reductase